MKRILFTGAGGAGTEAIWKLWHNKYYLLFADADVETISSDIPVEHRVSIPMASDPVFPDVLQKVCQKMSVDLLVPGVDEELSILASMKGKAGWPAILLPNQQFVDLMIDKFCCAQAIGAAGLSVPETVLSTDANKLPFPLIIKPRSGRGSRGVMKIDRLEQVGAYLKLYGVDSESIILQELIKGQEYTVFVCADNDANLRAVIPVNVGLKRGITIRAEVEGNQAIFDYAINFQKAFQPTGVYNIQCMLTKDGQVIPFEVNPRVSTTFCLAVSTGFDPIDLAVGNHQNNLEVFTPRESIQLRRSWKNNISPKAN